MHDPNRRDVLQGAAAIAGGLVAAIVRQHGSPGPALPAAARAAGRPRGQRHALREGRQAVLRQRDQLLGRADAGARRQPGRLGSGAARSRRHPGGGPQHDPDLRRDRRARHASRSGSCRRSSRRWASTIRPGIGGRDALLRGAPEARPLRDLHAQQLLAVVGRLRASTCRGRARARFPIRRRRRAAAGIASRTSPAASTRTQKAVAGLRRLHQLPGAEAGRTTR